MPEKCRVGVCGFDPMLVKAYAAANMRACWWHISDELFEEFDMRPGSKVSGKLLKIYSGITGEEEAAPNEAFEWETAKETGLVVLLPSDLITKYKVTAFHFFEMLVEKIDGKDVYPGEEKTSKKWWPEDKMKLDYTLDYIE
jgi:hypothetical protein